MAAPLTPAAKAFLATAGWADAAVHPVEGDASFRRYVRLRGVGESAILMDAPPPEEDVRPFVAMARWLADHGFSAPVVHAADLDAGLVLLNDLGERRMREAVDADPTLERPIYAAAIDLLVRLRDVVPADLPLYDDAVLHRETALLTGWWAPAAGLGVDEAGYRAAWTEVFAALPPPTVTTLRDYHSENIMLTDEGLALLDFQDALVGHPAYDLVSLLQDARRDVSPALEMAMLDRYRVATGEGDAFDAAYAILGAQRGAKVMGIFARLSRRDGKHRYLPMIPRVRAHLERDLAHPALAPVACWWADNIPVDAHVDAP